MSTLRLSETFRYNIFFWNIFGIWSRGTNKYYKYYSVTYLLFTLIIYDILLTLNLFYTPRKIELLIHEVIFYFTEVAVMAKVIMILFMRHEIQAVFKMLDCEPFKSDDEVGRKIVEDNVQNYKIYWKIFASFCNIFHTCLVILPILTHLIIGTDLNLPVCNYYFLSDEFRSKYFIFLFCYQIAGMFGHLMYNVNIDTFIAGLLMMAITQLKLINYELITLKLEINEQEYTKVTQEYIQMMKLNKCLRHYDLTLQYCSSVQSIISVTMFIQFGTASANICCVLCSLLLPSTSKALYIWQIGYLCAITCQIFVPGWLGSQLIHESTELVNAAYKSEWIPRSEKFKRSIRLFVERANAPIVMKGLKLFPLSLGTFTSIMKSAYSFFTLVQVVQDRQEQKY